MSILSKLFGGGAQTPAATAETYKDFSILPVPQKDGGGWRIAAEITKGDRTHHLIRADVVEGKDAADDASVRKAKQMIDEQGDRLFD